MAANNVADREKLHEICAMSYKAQAIWFLNGFWDQHQGEAEKFWAYVELAGKIDVENREEGSGLDELNAHRLLEIFDETLTVREMRTQLRSVGAIDEKERPKLVPLAHLLLARYKVDWHHFVNAPQGASDEIDKAQAKLDACKQAFEESNQRAEEAAAALAESEAAEAAAKAAEEEALAREADAREAEAPFKAAQEEVEAALADLKREEDEYNGKIEDCKRRSEEGGVVTRNKAKNELAQLLAEDPLPLRRAKITLEAANRKADKARAPFQAATEKAEAARAAASERAAEASRAADASRDAKQAADEALARAEAALAEAEEYLKEVSKHASGGKGALWWIERELHEQKKFLPESRGGIRK